MIDETIEEPDANGRRALLDALALAFRDNPMNIAIHGGRPSRRVRANRGGLRALVLDTADRASLRVIRRDGKVVGGFVAIPPGEFPIDSPSLHRQLWCLLNQGGRAMERWSEVTTLLGQFHPEEPHWYLAVLGVMPEFQGRGLGGQLLEELARLANRDGHPLYLESDREESVRFYQGRGFEIRAEARLFGVQCWSLGRGFCGKTEILCDSVREFGVSDSSPPRQIRPKGLCE